MQKACHLEPLRLMDTQAETEKLATQHKAERAKLLSDLEARTELLTAAEATVAECDAAHSALKEHAKELQVHNSLRCHDLLHRSHLTFSPGLHPEGRVSWLLSCPVAHW